MKKTWLYYGIFFSTETKRFLLERATECLTNKLGYDIPSDWRIYCDHVTIVFNDGTSDAQLYADVYDTMLGDEVLLNATHIGISDHAIAFQVDYATSNVHSHVTVAVAPNARPVESNNIKQWIQLDEQFSIRGHIDKIVPSKS